MTASNWKILRYWPFVRGIQRSPVNFPDRGQWRGVLVFCLICAWINGWVNNRAVGDSRHYRAHYDVTVMFRDVLLDFRPLCALCVSSHTRLLNSSIACKQFYLQVVFYMLISLIFLSSVAIKPCLLIGNYHVNDIKWKFETSFQNTNYWEQWCQCITKHT